MVSKSNTVNAQNNEPVLGMVERFFIVSTKACAKDAVSVTSNLVENALVACSVLTSDYDMSDDDKFTLSDRMIRDALFGVEQTLRLAQKSVNFAALNFPGISTSEGNLKHRLSGMITSIHAAADDFGQVQSLIQQVIKNLKELGGESASPAILDLLYVISKLCSNGEDENHRYADECNESIQSNYVSGGRDE